MLSFVYEALSSRVIFGVGCLDKLSAEAERLSVSRALVLSTPEQQGTAREVADRLGKCSAGLFTEAVMHVPIEIATAATARVRELDADCCVAVGGGSTTGLAKAIALTTGLPIIAIPTSYAGSEMTPIWGLTQGGVKKTGRDTCVLPRTVLYDPALTVTMPPLLSATSGINSIAHCVEALYAKDANPIISLLAEEGMRAISASLPQVVKQPDSLEARSRLFMGRGWEESRSAPWAWRYITSCATRSAGLSICRTPRRTPSSYRMHARTMRQPRRKRSQE